MTNTKSILFNNGIVIMKKNWETYEEVSIFLLNEFSEKFDLRAVEDKQKILGSDTEWEIDGKGILLDGTAFIVVECRQYRSSKQSQEKVAALAYKIQDLGAAGGIIVSPLGLQEGAERIAKKNNIVNVKLSANSTTSEYILLFLNNVCIGVADRFNVSATLIGGSLETVVSQSTEAKIQAE